MKTNETKNPVDLLALLFGPTPELAPVAPVAPVKKAPAIKVGRFGGMFGVFEGFVCISTHLTESAAKAAAARL